MSGTGTGDNEQAAHRHAAELERLAAQLAALRREPSPRGRPGLVQLTAERSARRPSDRERRNDELAAVLPFRRPDEPADEAVSPEQRTRRSGQTRTPAEQRARKEAKREAAAEALAAQIATDPESVARELCLGWLALRPHTRAELSRKLTRKGVPPEAVADVLDRYGEVGLVDDTSFADTWVRSRHTGRGLAKRALAYELRSRGVDATTVETAVNSLGPDEEEATARALVSRKLASMGHVPAEARARRLMGMLARKGYPAGLAARVVRDVMAGSGVDIPDPD